MSESIPSGQSKPRALLRFTPAGTTYQEILDNGAALPDWIKSFDVVCAVDLRVAHWGVADGDTQVSVTAYETITGGDSSAVIGRRDGLRVFISGASGDDVEMVARATSV